MSFFKNLFKSSKPAPAVEVAPTEPAPAPKPVTTPAPQPEYQPQNRLEELLKAAANDISARPEFMRQVFHFNLLVLGTVEDAPDGSKRANFFVRTDASKTNFISAFTSEAALNFAVSLDPQLPKQFIGLKTSALFEMVQNQLGVFVNPGLSFGKAFLPNEIAALLKGGAVGLNEVKIPAQTEMLIGMPKIMPNEFLESLKKYAKTQAKIHKVYFGMHSTATGDSMAYHLAVEFQAGTEKPDTVRIFQDIGQILSETHALHPFAHGVDLMIATDQDIAAGANGSLMIIG